MSEDSKFSIYPRVVAEQERMAKLAELEKAELAFLPSGPAGIAARASVMGKYHRLRHVIPIQRREG